MKLERLLNMVEEYMQGSNDAALMRRKDEQSGVLLIVYASNVQEFLAQAFKAIYGFTGAEAPDTWLGYLAAREVSTLQAVLNGDLAAAFKLLNQMAAAEQAGDEGALQTFAAQLEEVLRGD